MCFKTIFKLTILGFIGWFASGLSRVKGSIIYIFMLGVSLFLLLISAFCFLYMANFDDPAISLSKTLDEMVKIEYNTNDNIAKVGQYKIKWGTSFTLPRAEFGPNDHRKGALRLHFVQRNG